MDVKRKKWLERSQRHSQPIRVKRATLRGQLLNVRFASTLVIAVSIIAAVCLARDESISRRLPRLYSIVSESVSLHGCPVEFIQPAVRYQ
jgi:hypothetical protein